MKPPDGMDLRITDRDLANNTVTVTVTAREVIHACPPNGSDVMPCCERTPYEVPRWHRMTTDGAAVTCGAIHPRVGLAYGPCIHGPGDPSRCGHPDCGGAA